MLCSEIQIFVGFFKDFTLSVFVAGENVETDDSFTYFDSEIHSGIG